MVRLPSGLTVGLSAQPVKMRQKPDPAKFELAVSLIKKFEGLHGRDNFPYYGFGHSYPNLDIILTLHCK